MLNISSPEKDLSSQDSSFSKHPVFDLLFRTHFLLAAFASIVSLVIWLSYFFHGSLLNSTGLSPIVWHTHEMIFTFAATVAVGFIMTAVQTWTGQKSIRNTKAMLIVMLWLICHTLFWLNTTSSVLAATLLKALWWFSIVFTYTVVVFKAKNRRNYLFIPLLTCLGALNITVLILDQLGKADIALHLSKTAVLVFTLLISILGGRVIPFFTANATRTPQVKPIIWLDYLTISLSIIGASFFAFSINNPSNVYPGLVMISVGLLQLVRSARWFNANVLAVPLLWSLHIAYYFMAIGLIVMGASYFQLPFHLTLSQGIHTITVGAIGLMILSMMSRVSLGHTGRLLQPKPLIIFAFLNLILATLIRVLLPTLGYLAEAIWISALLWFISFTLFLIIYFPVLTRARLN